MRSEALYYQMRVDKTKLCVGELPLGSLCKMFRGCLRLVSAKTRLNIVGLSLSHYFVEMVDDENNVCLVKIIAKPDFVRMG